ncbi:hypothetical protein [Paenibacillus sp. S150]|nr:hypothetical protein [Paenibacillus sp. S150]MBW4085693.1 hypothetical protein [Paenibacillus sp. S150]
MTETGIQAVQASGRKTYVLTAAADPLHIRRGCPIDGFSRKRVLEA